jgi:hypothetical protein
VFTIARMNRLRKINKRRLSRRARRTELHRALDEAVARRRSPKKDLSRT